MQILLLQVIYRKKIVQKCNDDYCFVITNFISTKIKIHLQPMNVKESIVYHLKAFNCCCMYIYKCYSRANEIHIGIKVSW